MKSLPFNISQLVFMAGLAQIVLVFGSLAIPDTKLAK
jgi:hypothetical protein